MKKNEIKMSLRSPLIQFDSDEGKVIATILSDGTVELKEKGADKKAAELFWNSLQIEGMSLFEKIKNLEKELEVKDKQLKELKKKKRWESEK